jgi:hypothetical protein
LCGAALFGIAYPRLQSVFSLPPLKAGVTTR